jgi:hypothetical protein
MSKPHVTVTVEGGVAQVDVFTPGLVVEVRDYDVDGVDEDLLSTDEHGDRCVRYFASSDEEGASK